MNGIWLETAPLLGQAARLRVKRALRSRDRLSYVATRGGQVRLRRLECAGGPKLLFAADGPNVIEHYDELLRALEGRADVAVFEPPGTGGSAPARGFDFTVQAFADSALELLRELGPRTLVFPCYTGIFGQAVARAAPELVRRAVFPQTASWADFARWADGVDRTKRLRTPVLGQLMLAVGRRAVAKQWYAASTGDRKFRAPFLAAANEAFDTGGCFCLASLMQGFAASPAPPATPLSMPSAIVWGPRDRTHQASTPAASLAGAEVVPFEGCGHSPELEAPGRFAEWLLGWHRGENGSA